MNLDKFFNLKEKDSQAAKRIRGLFQLWVVSCSVMWGYVLYSYISFPTLNVFIFGLIASILHTTVPLIIKHSSSLSLAGLVLSLTGVFFQTAFCYYSGGFYSPAAIWFSLHPVILAFFGDKVLIFMSVLLNALILMGFYFLETTNSIPESTLTTQYRDIMTLSSYIGLDVLIAIFTLIIMKIYESKVEEIDSQKKDIENLLRILSHDLNNPLSILKNYHSRLSSDFLEKNPKVIAKLQNASGQLENIVSSTRVWAASSNNKINFKEDIIYFKDIQNHILDIFEDKLIEKNIDFLCENNSKNNIITDKDIFLNNVVSNVISNAIKFSYKDSKIEFIMDENEDSIILSFIDHGVGIKSNKIKDIFDPHNRNSTLGTSNEKGTGFGLPIVKSLTDKLGGSIKILNLKDLNKEKSGTCIQFYFPKKALNREKIAV